MEFGDILRQIRMERGLSLDELAAILNTTKQVLSRYETKKRIPRIAVVAEYARILGMPTAVLLGEHADPPREITRENDVKRVPILGGAACGEPIFSPSDGTEFVAVDADVPCDFALIAQGDSMTGDRIFSGDLVFIRKQDNVRDGEIAAVAIDNELTLKRIRRLRGPDGRVVFTQLLPSNPSYSPIDIGGEDETRCVNILGKAVAVRFMI